MWRRCTLTTRVLVGGGLGRHGGEGGLGGFLSRYPKLEHLDNGEVDLEETTEWTLL